MAPLRTCLLFLVPLAALLASACASGSGGESGGLWVELAGERYQVELADDDRSRARGLMFRESMAADRGMLFIHDRADRQAYWMKNTLIPLDILYFDTARRLVSQQRDVPPCRPGGACASYPSEAPALYVLELNAGEAERLGLQNGVELEFGPGIPGR
ncbi:DUF192 domain-containing protein [Lysobacter sp. GX 14042]|uniref:DUF192 domain-containing protein n=1 Tax=Lysobacter sp. GX 14042 TaxID=2907155 RepID=UPI001F237DC0|nr:DUF192 domain-containing protein [Lysobacter sp. GX 14042]MCE7033541.1 DUF192 domain-containing protein [Lysobacter sp. GX 14042]